MIIMLGNQTIDQIENRLHIKLSDDHKKELQNTWQQKAEYIASGKWHCFDIPFLMMCGDFETASHFRDIFFQYDLSNAERFQISWER